MSDAEHMVEASSSEGCKNGGMSCPLCGSSEVTTLGSLEPDESCSGEDVYLMSCDSCGGEWERVKGSDRAHRLPEREEGPPPARPGGEPGSMTGGH